MTKKSRWEDCLLKNNLVQLPSNLPYNILRGFKGIVEGKGNMRLIDADKLMEEVTGYIYDTYSPEARRAAHNTQALYQGIIQRQPTAYDVDKVMERLEKRIENLKTLNSDDEIVDVALKEIRKRQIFLRIS